MAKLKLLPKVSGLACENCGRIDDTEEYNIDLPISAQTVTKRHLADLCSLCAFGLGAWLIHYTTTGEEK